MCACTATLIMSGRSSLTHKLTYLDVSIVSIMLYCQDLVICKQSWNYDFTKNMGTT